MDNIKPSSQQIDGTHYKNMSIQPIIFSHRNKLGVLESSVIKYITRHGKKGGKEGGKIDLQKAIHCIELLLEEDYDG